MAADDNTSDRGLGSPNMSDEKKHEIQSKGGKASHGGAAGSTEAAAKGGRHSHGGGGNSS
ncbi:MAG TPA: hypothetical protein VG964_02120 [Candidatus Saccharimonadales bacterium]|nr:hypothetical protein [Candidatus Saccharimonadales bacterium]